ncbi:transposase [Bacillus cereus]|uniref:transposase n=1 Tax=Bacillus cereus TaxID=1396 RepID=UPI0021B29843|nr:transposase [Bacillus cereus]
MFISFCLTIQSVVDKEVIYRKTTKLDNNNHLVTWANRNCGEDHVHILFRFVPNIDFSKVINSYKSVSFRFVKRDFLR